MTQIEQKKHSMMKLIKAILLSLLTISIIFILFYVRTKFPIIATILLIIVCFVAITEFWYNSLNDKGKKKED